MTASAIGSYATATALKQMIGITDTNDDTLLGLICDRVNQLIETTCRQVIAPISSAAYLYDGNGLSRIFLPRPVNSSIGIGGARAVSLVEFAPYTSGTFETVASTDYVLRSPFGNGGPYRWLLMSDQPAGTYHDYPDGQANIRVTMTAGWAAIPDDVTELALNLAHRAWNARQSGQQNVVGSDESGQPYVARYLDGKDKMTLRAYTLKAPV